MTPIRDDNPTILKPFITVALIICCVMVILWQISHSEGARQIIVYALSVIAAVLFEGAIMPEEIPWIPPGLTVVTRCSCTVAGFI
jgi:FtsH-binding integral membrane protein